MATGHNFKDVTMKERLQHGMDDAA